MNYKLLHMNIHGDAQGNLISIESMKNIPFEFKRMYYIFGTQPNIRRGKHAHKKTEQVLIAIKGSCKLFLDDGTNKETIKLNKNYEVLYLPPNLWHEMYDFSTDCVLVVLASDFYNENDYLRKYDDFLKYWVHDEKNN